mmetsp:Transcript_18650/g.28103  ORF Transcript_18650/g.28103 Transcript_18650/m.28103 type:complete len:266 (+) Transcript_18650:42-839(+)
MSNEVRVLDRSGNPAPLGLLAFGLTTIALNLHNAGMFELDSMILGLGFFYGGCAQIVAGCMEWTKGNTFATTAFISYGSFWLSLCVLVIAPKSGAITAPTRASMASYFFVWGSFTAVLLCAAKTSMLKVVFFSLTCLFYLLTIFEITHSMIILRITGIEGIFTGLSAMYTGLAQILNESKGRTVWPTDNIFNRTFFNAEKKIFRSNAILATDEENQHHIDETTPSLSASKAIPPKQRSFLQQDISNVDLSVSESPFPSMRARSTS